VLATWDIVIYGGYSSSEALRDACFVGIYQSFEYWTPDERPLERANEHGQTPIGPGTPPTAICPRPGQKKYIDALSDNDIIDSYITCSGCGAKFVPLDDLDLIVKRTRSAAQFIAAIAPHTH